MRILYNGKWDGIWDRPKYQAIREKVIDTFKELVFIEEGHKYFLHGKEITCVSNVTHMYKPEFDTDAIAKRTYEWNFDDPDSKYYHKTVEEIKAMWKEKSTHACEHGTERHEFGESCFYYMTKQYDKILPAFKDRLTEDGGFRAEYAKEEAIVKLYEDLPVCFIPILSETKVYDEELGYSGTFDILFYYDPELDISKKRGQEGLVVFDWKTNEDLYKNFKDKRLLAPFEALKDMPLSIYKLQLSLYQNCLEKIGLKVVARRILWLRESGEYEKINLESYVEALRLDLSKKKNII